VSLKLHNTRTAKKEVFSSLRPREVRMYVCGPTVYNLCHIGHARCYVTFDVLRRYLEFLGYKVTHVQNFTDVEASIYERAEEEGTHPLSLAEKYIEEYFKDMDRLSIKRAHWFPRVSDHIKEMIEITRKLIEKGCAYNLNGDVYFRADKAGAFGKLIHQPLKDLIVNEMHVKLQKESPLDFALWKKARKGQLCWESPWGKGWPGWHIECYAMATKYLGQQIDIHGGGLDLAFPHHESEALISEAYANKEFSNFWVHNGFVTVREEKMSKSLANFVTLREVLNKYEGDVVRLFLLSAHYRKTIDYNEAALRKAKRRYELIGSAFDKARKYARKGTSSAKEGKIKRKVKEVKKKFFDCVENDLDTKNALFIMEEFSQDVVETGNLSKEAGREIFTAYLDFAKILGLF